MLGGPPPPPCVRSVGVTGFQITGCRISEAFALCVCRAQVPLACLPLGWGGPSRCVFHRVMQSDAFEPIWSTGRCLLLHRRVKPKTQGPERDWFLHWRMHYERAPYRAMDVCTSALIFEPHTLDGSIYYDSFS